MENNVRGTKMEKEKYVLYQYLKFICRKKWFLIGVTIVFMILGFLFSLRTPVSYVGHALVFTGNANNDLLSKPDLISEIYKVTAKVPGPFEVTMDITGNTLQGTDQQIKKVANKYVADLKKRYNAQLKARKDYVNALNQQIKQLSDQQGIEYNANLKSGEPTPDEKLADLNYKIYKMESPELIDTTTSRTGNNSIRNAILGAAFGFQLMLIILVIWKYILDAKRTLTS